MGRVGYCCAPLTSAVNSSPTALITVQATRNIGFSRIVNNTPQHKLSAQDGPLAPASRSLLDHDRVMLKRDPFCQLSVHDLLLRKFVHGRKHTVGPRRAVDH